jgi:hypothetical protein
MTTSIALVSPVLLNVAAVFIFGMAATLVALHTGMLAIAGGRTSLSPRARVLAPMMAALVLGGWLGWALVMAQQSALVGPVSGPRSPVDALPTLAVIVVAIAIGAAFLASRTVRTLNAAIPSAWLIGIQVYRMAGITFIWPFMSDGTLPAGFALPAGIGDALTGLAAPFVAWAIARRRPGAYGWAVAWNWFGIIDLVVAPTAAVLSGAQVAAIYPLGLIPIFLGPPLGILTHLYSLRNLAVNRTLFSSAPVTAK